MRYLNIANRNKCAACGVRLWTIVLLVLLPINANFALGNYPEAGVCPADKPYFAFCTHSLHNLEGWHGHCYASREQAMQEAEQHIEKHHHGNNRWTGVMRSK